MTLRFLIFVEPLRSNLMENIKVAIIIPVYNTKNYIPYCLDSILSQTYSNWEAICIDDGSVDGSSELLDTYAKKDSRIKVYHKQNGGAGSARNLGLSYVQASPDTWISFVDSDDYISSTMYSDIISTLSSLKTKDCDYIRLFCNHVSRRGEFIHDETSGSQLMTSSEYFKNREVGGYTCSLFVRSTLVSQNELTFPINMKTLEDQVFSIKCALLSKNILLYRKRHYHYVDNESGLTKSAKSRVNDIVSCINELYPLLSNSNSCHIRDYLYNTWLPIKVDMLVSESLKFNRRGEYLPIIINVRPYIKSFKGLLKYYLAKFLGRI